MPTEGRIINNIGIPDTFWKIRSSYLAVMLFKEAASNADAKLTKIEVINNFR